MTRVNLGCGQSRLAGYIPIDRKLGTEAYPMPETVDLPEPVAKECGLEQRSHRLTDLDEIRASHLLEHFPAADVPSVLHHWMSRLKPGGRLRIAVPDFDKIMSMRDQMAGMGNGTWDEHVARRWQAYLMGAWTDENDRHGAIFTADELRSVMEQAGLTNVQAWKAEANSDTATHPVSLNLEGIRPERVEEPGMIKIVAAMSVPRLGWQDAYGCQLRALTPHKIPIRTYTGAFWEQGIQCAMEDSIKDGIDWILTMDYDSLFTYRDVDRLIDILGQNPQIDAVAALQVRRGMPYPLMTIKGASKLQITNTPVKVDTAHFGLTLLRLECLNDIPKPWFQGQAATDGTWRHYSRTDPDIWFWRQWTKAGKSVYITPDVRIGHLEVMVAEFDENGGVRHSYVKDWVNATGTVTVGE